MIQIPSLLTDRLRYGLRLNPKLGAGNFLHHAYAINAGREIPLVHSDEPFEVLGGRRLSVMSIAELKDITDRYAAWFLAHSITPMDPVAVYCRENVQYLIQYIALTAIGAVPVLTNGTMRADVATQHFRRIGVVGIVTDRDHRAALAPYFGNGDLKLLHTLEDIPEDVPSDLPPWFPFEHDHHHPVMITHSSGTTGDPKPIVLEHGTWFYGIRQLLGLDTAQGADRYLSSLPTSHNASIAYAMHAILNGAALMIMADHSGVSVARTIERFRPATVVSFPQTFVDLAALDLDGFDLNSVTTWINSGDAAHEAHIRRLVAHGFHYRGDQRVPGSQFVDGLGSSEMGHSSFRIIHTPYTDSYDRCVGIPQSWVEATVFDSGGQPAPIGVIGRLGIHSPSVTAGYWNDSLLTYKSRRHGYWLTGDLAYRDRLGCYYHVDRVSDVIPTRDGPLYSLQTEELILKHQGSRLVDCTVIGVTEEGTDAGTQVPVVLAVPRTGCSVDTAALLNEINQAQACKNRPSLAQAYFVDWSEVPLGVTGKVLKRTLREQFESGARRLERTSRLGAGTRG